MVINFMPDSVRPGGAAIGSINRITVTASGVQRETVKAPEYHYRSTPQERGDIADESPSLRRKIEEEKPCYVDLFGNLSPHWTEKGVPSVIEKYFLHDCSENLFRFTNDDWAVCAELGLTLDEVCTACAEFRFQEHVNTLEQFFADTEWTADMPVQDAIQQVEDFYRWRNQHLPRVREIFKNARQVVA